MVILQVSPSFPRSAWERTAATLPRRRQLAARGRADRRRLGIRGTGEQTGSRRSTLAVIPRINALLRGATVATRERRGTVRSHAERGNEGLVPHRLLHLCAQLL